MDLSAVQLVDFQAFMDGNNDAAAKITTLPVLMLQGTLDRLVKAQGTWEIFNELGTKNKTFIELPSEHLVIEYGRKLRAIPMIPTWFNLSLPGWQPMPQPQAPRTRQI
jgi:alpha-beta hydrolase superfamily lysophospholipase